MSAGRLVCEFDIHPHEGDCIWWAGVIPNEGPVAHREPVVMPSRPHIVGPYVPQGVHGTMTSDRMSVTSGTTENGMDPEGGNPRGPECRAIPICEPRIPT